MGAECTWGGGWGLGWRMFPVTGKQVGGGGDHICPHSITNTHGPAPHLTCVITTILHSGFPHPASGETEAPESAGKHASKPGPARGARSENAQLQRWAGTQPGWSPPRGKRPIKWWLQQGYLPRRSEGPHSARSSATSPECDPGAPG